MNALLDGELAQVNASLSGAGLAAIERKPLEAKPES